ncbi:M20 family metallopeptidase [Primorskyibacter aestuariivivens]|uniref:M20 aminoacylase family protein n=1 Tax=Primorskyibacter aestuariivivens TaxID=1888912 RepID=UPI0023012456|nr:M20 aminoacylase family protein [Primorskyibacter aestuariivivens]MDA7430591.1 M20 family metallopeptidase [Primorskyibacter aestuariivivens]
MAVINRIAGYADDLTAWRRHLHMHPELALDCHETAGFVVEKLSSFGVDEIHEGIATSGVVAIIDGQGDGPCTGLRADMDALPMDEETGVEYASRVPGRMHACGHDGHTTMLLGAARYLAETRNFAGRVALIFQPAEEIIGGGRIMVQDEQIMDRFDIDEVYGLHTFPFAQAGTISTAPGPLLAAVDDYIITIKGKGGHAAYPEECVDPLIAATALHQAFQTIVSRNAKPLDSIVVSVTQIHGGSALNVIPDKATVAGTVRTYAPELRALAEKRIREIIDGVALTHGVAIELEFLRGYPPTVNHPDQTALAVQVAREVAGAGNVNDALEPEMGAEDFSYMLEARPGAFLMLGQGIGPSCHHPAFDFNDEVAPIGASFFARLVETRQPIGGM